MIFSRLCHPSLKWHLLDKNHRTIKAAFRTNWTVIRGEGEEKDPSLGCEPLQARGLEMASGFQILHDCLAIDVAVTQEIPVNPSQSQRKNAKVFVHCFNCNMTFWRYGFNIYTFKWVKQIFQKPGCRHDSQVISHKSHKWHLCKMFLGWGKIT